MSDIFQEVEEELQREKLEQAWKKYGPWILGTAALIVAVTAGVSSWNQWRADKQTRATSGLNDILTQNDLHTAQGAEALGALARQFTGSAQAALAQLQQAGISLKLKEKDKALAVYDALEKNEKADPLFRQLATLLAVQTQLDEGDPATLRARLESLTKADQPWRVTALEYTALLAARAGDKAEAKRVFDQIAADTTAPQAARTRATDLAKYYGDNS